MPSRARRRRLRRSGRHTILFVDEVHRFNKAQQDAFLPYVEQGVFTFIGATTENPSFEVIGALLSRAAVYVLEPLAADELDAAARSRAGSGCAGPARSTPRRATADRPTPMATGGASQPGRIH